MIIASFNVNSVRLRLHQLDALIQTINPDVIGLQETKVNDPDFPVEAIEALGYQVIYHGQKTHYGVALMSRVACENVQLGFPTDGDDAQKRIIAADFKTPNNKTVRVINGYFPQGESRDHAVKFPAKEKFFADLLTDLQSNDTDAHVALIGDFNVAPVDNDIGIGADNAKRWLRTGKTSFLPEEREWLQALCDWGLTDCYREKYPDVDDRFSWFDYRSKGFDREPKRGLRIDHVLASSSLIKHLTDSGIDYDIRAMEKPSDHCPIWASFDV